ncbi:hydroxyacid dehydrogenase [Roseibium polysiphoniae]|uniref:Hydroxyacid dehydrogenase n=1 Tax=Roseibium polysiphoniae TaxID=2571221 RepID=A0A944GUF7_9HYPH|nr:NAD(P)-dependent oxidoreductase [Roseibium polysiphoniae]MBS8261606.1 hydroxyacid dehydrogenase [Roseibium polysiphoniae]
MESIVLAQPVENNVVDVLEQSGVVDMNPGPEPFGSEELAHRCQSASAVMAFMTERIDAEFLDRCPELRIVAGALKGYDNIDVDACSRRGVAVSIVPDLLTDPTAELTVAMMIALARHSMPADRHVRAGKFNGWRPTFFGSSLVGATVGIIGAGKLGQAVMRMLTGFGGPRLYHDVKRLSLEWEAAYSAEYVSPVEICRRADSVVLALPLTAETQGIVDAEFLKQMRPQAYLINTARGSLVDEAAIADALEAGTIAGYAADVFEFEDWARVERPWSIEARLITSPKTVLSPHLGSAVTDIRRQITESAADSIIKVLAGGLPDTVINRPYLKGR